MYRKTTHNIKVSVTPEYLDKQSEPGMNQYVWAYTIRLENMGDVPVQLVSRYWQITNALGQVQEVRGEGVVGEKPLLEPGKTYEYSSGAALTTPSGIMVGSYQMVKEGGGITFDVDIPAFSLDSPYEVVRTH